MMEIIKKKERKDVHPYVPELKDLYRGGRITRRDFIRHAAMLGVSLSSIGVFLGAGGKGVARAASSTPVRGGTLRTEYNWIPYVKDPAADGVGTGLVGLAIAEPLVWVGEDAVPRPQLAKSWEASADAKEWTLHLQQGVKFNNGKPFNADDVIWNFKHWLDKDAGSSMAAKLDFLPATGIEKVDDYTIKCHLNRSYFAFPLALYDYPSMIAPEGGWDDFYKGDAKHAIGTGPFLMESFTPDERMVLVRNPNYWQKGADGKALPYVDKVVVTAGWDDPARLAALIGNEADLLTPGEGVIAELKKSGAVNVESFTTGWITPIVMRCDMAPFDDKRVRQALKLVQDREKIKALVQPMGKVGYDHWIPSTDAAYCFDTEKNQGQDIKKAKALLAEAGHPNGIELELAIPKGDFRTAYAQVYKEMATLAGINIKINMLPSSAFWDQWMKWPFSVSGWNGRIPATANINLALRCGGKWNESYYCNKDFEAVLNEADATVDVAKRSKLFCKIQSIMQEDSGYLIPFWAASFRARRKNVQLPDTWSRGGLLWHYMWLS
ncbi:MAG: ABC transporter substrate-binding protein [bacterium]|nr:ABC transporter substrate-binding protein [bacterium]